MINLTVTLTEFIQDGITKVPSESLIKGYVEKVDDNYIHIELNSQVIILVAQEVDLNGVIYPTSDLLITELRSIRGWVVPVEVVSIDFVKRQANINQMNSYMDSLRIEGLISQANFDLFLADTATSVQGYLNGGSRLITWIETVNRNNYNATTNGFKTRTAYRGTLVNGLYPRAENILLILNDL